MDADGGREGRPITGWRRGMEIKMPTDVAPGDVLIVDDERFNVTNLIRVRSMRILHPGAPVTGFYYRYVTPDLEHESSGGSGDSMLAWHFEIVEGGYFKAEPEDGNEIGERYKAERIALAEHNARWS